MRDGARTSVVGTADAGAAIAGITIAGVWCAATHVAQVCAAARSRCVCVAARSGKTSNATAISRAPATRTARRRMPRILAAAGNKRTGAMSNEA